MTPTPGARAAQDEVVDLAAGLVRIDTSNAGEGHPSTRGERMAAEHVAAALTEVGYDVTLLEAAPGRTSVVARLEGSDPGRGALLLHSHLDVVPAVASDWSVDPFAGEVVEGFLWGRGTVDMKHMAAMTLAVARELKRSGTVPSRDLVFAFLADEEHGGWLGARWLVEHHRGLLDGVTEAVGEVGGFSVTLGDDVRTYLVQTAEKGALWLRLAVEGTAGHGSLLHDDNPVAHLARAVSRLDAHRFPLVLSSPVREFLEGVAEITGEPFDLEDPEAALGRLGSLARLVGATLRDTANVTMIEGGEAPNVVPSTARATIDCRVLPGREAAFERELLEVLGPGVDATWGSMPGVATSFDGTLVDEMTAALRSHDPTARVLPFMLSAGTDAKAFAPLGIRCFGFAPLRLPPGLDFVALFHGVDERVPVDALTFGTAVLHELLSRRS